MKVALFQCHVKKNSESSLSKVKGKTVKSRQQKQFSKSSFEREQMFFNRNNQTSTGHKIKENMALIIIYYDNFFYYCKYQKYCF